MEDPNIGEEAGFPDVIFNETKNDARCMSNKNNPRIGKKDGVDGVDIRVTQNTAMLDKRFSYNIRSRSKNYDYVTNNRYVAQLKIRQYFSTTPSLENSVKSVNTGRYNIK